MNEARTNVSDATAIVMGQFGIKNKSELSEAHVALIQETRQIYGLKYWIGKPNDNSKPNGD